MIIGGYAFSSSSSKGKFYGEDTGAKEMLISLSNPTPLIYDNEDMFRLDLRPSFHTMCQLGWSFERAYFSIRDDLVDHSDAFYIFTKQRS